MHFFFVAAVVVVVVVVDVPEAGCMSLLFIVALAAAVEFLTGDDAADAIFGL